MALCDFSVTGHVGPYGCHIVVASLCLWCEYLFGSSCVFLLMAVQQLLWFWCVCERELGSRSFYFAILSPILMVAILEYTDIWILPTSLRVLLDSSGVGANWKASAGVQRRNYKAIGEWWKWSVDGSPLEHYFGWLLMMKLDWSLLLNSFCWVFESAFLFACGTMFDKCSRRTHLYSTILIIFASSWLLWSALPIGEVPEVLSAVNAHKAHSGGVWVFREMVLQMLEALLSSK